MTSINTLTPFFIQFYCIFVTKTIVIRMDEIINSRNLTKVGTKHMDDNKSS